MISSDFGHHARDPRILFESDFAHLADLQGGDGAPKAFLVDTSNIVQDFDVSRVIRRKDHFFKPRDRIDESLSPMRAFLAAIERESGLVLLDWKLHTGGRSTQSLGGTFHQDSGDSYVVTSTPIVGAGTKYLAGAVLPHHAEELETDLDICHFSSILAYRKTLAALQNTAVRKAGLVTDEVHIGQTLAFATDGLWHGVPNETHRVALFARFRRP